MEHNNLESFFEIYKSMLDGLLHTVPYFESKYVLKKILIHHASKIGLFTSISKNNQK